MELLDQDPDFYLKRQRDMRRWSPSLSSVRHQSKRDFSQMRIQHTPCGSTLIAPSLVPTTSEVGFGSQNRDGGHYRRIGILKRRIEGALDAMEVLLRRKPKEPDGEEELERRRTRSVEFLSRFSRNYLFQIRIQIMELKRHMQSSPFASPGRHTQHQFLLKKLVAAYQTAVQGLQACLNQLPGSLHDSAILSKLDQLLCYLCELTSMKLQIDFHACLTESDQPREDSMKTKAQNLVAIVRKKRMEREGANEGWRGTATVLARKRFGSPLKTKAKIASLHETKSSSKADRHGKKLRPIKKLRIRKDFQGGDNQPSPHPVSNFNQSKPRVDSLADASLDPATALELKMIMSRMKDILRGAQPKSLTPSEPTYPPNVRLVYITHEEDSPKDDKPEEQAKENVILERDCPTEEVCMENGPQALSEIVRTSTKPNSQDIQTKLSSDCDEEPETRSPASNSVLRRKRLTPEEHRIIKYRNRFRSYKERVGRIQQTSERILSTVFQEVAKELEPSILLDKMYHLELQG